MTETVQTIDEQIAELRAKKSEARLLEEQRTKLLPRIESQLDRWEKEAAALAALSAPALQAVKDIDEGRRTDYRVRKAPVRKKKAAGKGEVWG